MKKQARKKGNLKPASSTKAAALLSIETFNIPLGFDGLIGTENDVSAESFTIIDRELLVAFRKLNKKDATTREKTLKELHDILPNRKTQSIETALQFWLRSYSKLAVDGSARVRAASHRLMGLFCYHLGREIVKNVKETVPYFFLGQNDPYREVISAAKTAFESAFRTDKRMEALKYCFNSTVSICIDLINGTGLVARAQKYDTEETAELRNDRMLTTAFMTLEYLCRQISEEGGELRTETDLHAFWDNPTLWKSVANFKSPSVRSAIFCSFRAWISYQINKGNHFYSLSSSCTSCIVNHLKVEEPSISRSVFDCWLTCISLSHEAFWHHIQIEKTLLSNFVSILRKNHWNTSSIVGPCLLPSLSAIYEHSEDEKKEDILQRWMDALTDGVSKSEKTFWRRAFCDCFKFSFNKSIQSDAMRDFLLKNLLAFIELCVDFHSICTPLLLWSIESNDHQPFALKLFPSLTRLLIVRMPSSSIMKMSVTLMNSGDSQSELMTARLFCQCLTLDSASDDCVRSINEFSSCQTALDNENFWHHLLSMNWSVVEVVNRLSTFLLDPRVDLSSANARQLVFCCFSMLLSRMAVDEYEGPLLSFMSKLAGTSKWPVVTSFLSEVFDRLDDDRLLKWRSSSTFRSLWFNGVHESLVRQDAMTWSLLMEFIKFWMESTCEFDRILVKDTLKTLATWADSLQMNKVVGTHVSMIADLVRIIHKSDRDQFIANDKSMGTIIRQMFMLMVESRMEFNDDTLKEIIDIGLENREDGSHLFNLLTTNLVNQIDSSTDSLDRLIDCALVLSRHKKRANMDEFPFTSKQMDEMLDAANGQFSSLIWLSGICPLPATRPEASECDLNELHQLFNRAAFFAHWFDRQCICCVSAQFIVSVAAFGHLLHAKGLLEADELKQPIQLLEPALIILSNEMSMSFDESTLKHTESPHALRWLGRLFMLRWPNLELNKHAIDSLHVMCGSGMDLSDPLIKWTSLFQMSTFAEDLASIGHRSELLTDWISNHRDSMQDRLLFCCNRDSFADWPTVLFNISLIKFLNRMTVNLDGSQGGKQRDFLCCSLVSWLQVIDDPDQVITIFTCELLRLFQACARQEKQLDTFSQEWTGFFEPACANVIVPCFIRKLTTSKDWIFHELCISMQFVSKDSFMSASVPILLDPQLDGSLYSNQLQSILTHTKPLLASCQKNEQLAGWSIWKRAIKHISPILVAAELNKVADLGGKFENMTVTVRTKVGEVVARYQMEDTSMDLTVTLPHNYPLSLPIVTNDNAVVGLKLKRRWLLQLTVFLTQQNGSLLNGLLMWKRNIDRHLSGVQECMICMMAVHIGSQQLPKIHCRKCKKRFHGACLYKWFQSSSQSSCPLCRSLF